MLDATASILPIMMAPLSVQIARGCLEGVLQSRVLSVPASAGGPHQQGAVVGLRQTGQRLTSIPIPALMDGIPDRMRSPRVVGSPCTVIDAQMDRLMPDLLFSTPTGDRRFESGSLHRRPYC